jgi:hypothetical protein
LRIDAGPVSAGIHDGVLIPLALNGINGIIHELAVHGCALVNTVRQTEVTC